ncbi:MAG: AraC family transcriptional regulator [bacterium]|nr:AraC family transcriptional regulator [bacterium]
MDLKERVRYLQGLAAGLQVGDESPTGRVLNGVLEVLEQVATELREVNQSYSELEDYVECVDADLAEVEQGLGGEASSLTCPECGGTLEIPEEDEASAPEVTCPDCGLLVYEHREDLDTADEPEEMTGREERRRD